MTIITLSNGKRGGNFSSPHPFTFTDGSVLPACDNDMAEALKVTFEETPVMGIPGDVTLEFSLTKPVMEHMDRWMSRYYNGDVNVVFCALPMIVAIVEVFGANYLLRSPFRGVRMEDRIKKLASIDKQCVTLEGSNVQ